MQILGDRTRQLPAPPHVVFTSLTHPGLPGARPWLVLLDDEVPPVILSSHEPHRVQWSSLWPSRPNDLVDLELSPKDGGTLLRFILSTPDEEPDETVEAMMARFAPEFAEYVTKASGG